MSHVVIGVRSNALTTSNVIISDIGFIIPFGGTTVTYTDDLDITKLLSSEDLETLTQDGAYPAAAPGNINTLILTDGTNDIPPGGVDDFLEGIEAGRRNNCDATVDPGVNDDETLGYAVCSRWVNVSNNEAFICVDSSAGAAIWGRITGVVGNVETIEFDFAYNDTSPKDSSDLIGVGDTIIESEVQISTVFDDAAAFLTLSQVGGPTLLSSSAINPQALGGYGDDTNTVSSVSGAVRMTISPGTSTQGAGRVIVTIRRA